MCGKTFTITPNFALPNKHYVKKVVFQGAYEHAKDNKASYEKTAGEMCKGYCGVNKDGEPDSAAPPPRNPKTNNEPSLAASTIHRWITFLGEEKEVAREAVKMITERDPSSTLFRLTFSITAQKYRSQARKKVLQNCLKLVEINRKFEELFKSSLFPIFATACRDG